MGKYFGTDGIRGLANDKLTPKIAYFIGRYIGQYKNPSGNRIVVARDTRLSGQMLLYGLVSGILASGGDVVDLGVSTTPSIAYTVETKDFNFGVMISASHNPFFDNGIKLFDKSGHKISADIEKEIEKYIDNDQDELPLLKNAQIGTYQLGDKVVEDYINFIVGDNFIKKDLKIVMDLANGSATSIAKNVFDKFNLNIEYIANEPNGVNINEKCGSTHLSYLRKAILKKPGYYDLGISYDGDADRVLFMDGEGQEYDGDFILYLVANRLKTQNKLKNNKVVITVMANVALRRAFKDKEIDFEVVDVGDKYIQKALFEQQLSIGGEQSGHIIFSDILNTGDGILTAIQVLSIISAENKSIQQLCEGFGKYPQKLVNVTVDNKDAVLENKGLNDLICQLDEELNNNGRILVRKSGTEPFIRVMVEAVDTNTCNQVCDKLVDYITELNF